MPSTDVVITHDERIEDAIPAALEHLPLSSLGRGKRVAVKPNETWASEDDTTGITQPDTLRVSFRLCGVMSHDFHRDWRRWRG